MILEINYIFILVPRKYVISNRHKRRTIVRIKVSKFKKKAFIYFNIGCFILSGKKKEALCCMFDFCS